MRFAPSIAWDPTVGRYLENAFGPQKVHRFSESLCKPSLCTCLRVNTRRTSAQVVVQQLKQLFPHTQPYTHPILTSAVIVPGAGPLQPDYQLCGDREVLVNRYAGEAVLKGANVFAPGLLAATPGIAPDDLVAVSVAVGQPSQRWCGVNRGMTLTADRRKQLNNHEQHYIGIGRVTAGRRGLFRAQEGLAVEMVQRVFEIPPCNGVLRVHVMLQALPSMVAAQVLNPHPGSRVLDMCAAPGGKTTMLAQIMGDSGTVIALDRTQAKVQEILSLSSDWGLTCVQAYVADATQLYQQQGEQRQQWEGRHVQIGKAVAANHHHHQQQQQGYLPPKQGQPSEHAMAAASIYNTSKRSANTGMSSSSAVSSKSATALSLEPSNSSTYASSSSNSTQHSSKRRRTSSSASTAAPVLSPEILAAVQADSFDAVLLDAPCSALGLRPRLSVDWTLPALDKLAAYQRALLHSAVHLLKPGGHLVYCTCTINPGENEANVRYVLDKWPQMRLTEQPLRLGGPGLVGDGLLTAAEADLVQRFDPLVGEGDDTIGFFVAKFVKQGST